MGYESLQQVAYASCGGGYYFEEIFEYKMKSQLPSSRFLFKK
jgi:hypothetical protein